MSARRSAVRFLIRTAMVLGALFAVTILLAAMPGHNAPETDTASEGQEQTAAAQPVAALPRGSASIDLSDEKANEVAAMSDMSQMHGASEHLHMTAMRPQTAADLARANE